MTLGFLISLILFGVVMFFSGVMALAAARKPSQFAQIGPGYATYVVQNAQLITPKLLAELLTHMELSHHKLALEVLYKGGSKALVIYAPTSIKQYFKQLKLLEIEDYSLKLNDQHPPLFTGWTSPEPVLVKEDALKDLNLQEDEQLFWQINRSAEDPTQPFKSAFMTIISGVVVATSERQNSLNQLLAQQLDSIAGLKPNLQLGQNQLIKYYQSRTGEQGSAVVVHPDQLTKLIRI